METSLYIANLQSYLTKRPTAYNHAACYQELKNNLNHLFGKSVEKTDLSTLFATPTPSYPECF